MKESAVTAIAQCFRECGNQAGIIGAERTYRRGGMEQFNKTIYLLLKAQQAGYAQESRPFFLIESGHDLLTGPHNVSGEGTGKFGQGAAGNVGTILPPGGDRAITDQHDMQDYPVIASVRVMMVHEPIVGSYMKLNIAHDAPR